MSPTWNFVLKISAYSWWNCQVPKISAYSWWNCQVPNISAYSWWNCRFQRPLPTRGGTAGDTQRLQIEINYYPDSLLSISAGFLPPPPTHDHKVATKTTGPNTIHAPLDVGRRISRPCYKVSLSRLCSQRHQSRSELSMQQMFCMGARKMFRTCKCSSVSEK